MSVTGTRLDSWKEAGMAADFRRDGVRFSLVWDVLREVVSARVAETGRPTLDIIDVGGGTGGLAVPFAALGHNVTVVDPSPDALAAAPRRAAEAGGRDPAALRPARADRAHRGRRAACRRGTRSADLQRARARRAARRGRGRCRRYRGTARPRSGRRGRPAPAGHRRPAAPACPSLT